MRCVARTRVWRGCGYLRGPGSYGTPGVRWVQLLIRRWGLQGGPGWAELSSCTLGGKHCRFLNAGAGVASLVPGGAEEAASHVQNGDSSGSCAEVTGLRTRSGEVQGFRKC